MKAREFPKSQLPEMKKVLSTNISAVGYSLETEDMFIQFRGGAVFRYPNTDKFTFHSILNAQSVGSTFHQLIRVKKAEFELLEIKNGSKVFLENMTEPELSAHLNSLIQYIKDRQTEDTLGSMLIIFQANGITQYGATINPEDAPKALRELADRIEKRTVVTRN